MEDPLLLPVRPYPARSTPDPEELPDRLVEVRVVAAGVGVLRAAPAGRLSELPPVLLVGAYPLSIPRVAPAARMLPMVLRVPTFTPVP